MSNEDRSLREWIEDWDAGKFLAKDRKTQCDAGWYDWFCRDEGLAGRLARMASKVKRIAKSEKVDLDTMYVFFKNNCPLYGKLYDDFRICDRETGDVVYTITPRSGFDIHKGRAEVWGRENGFDGPLVAGTWKDVCRFFNV